MRATATSHQTLRGTEALDVGTEVNLSLDLNQCLPSYGHCVSKDVIVNVERQDLTSVATLNSRL